MDSRITVDVVEPDSTIQVPNTGGVVGGELSIHEMGAIGLGVVALFLIVVGIIVSAMKKKKGHRIFEKNKAFRIGMKKQSYKFFRNPMKRQFIFCRFDAFFYSRIPKIKIIVYFCSKYHQ